jgi:predicted metalloprotease with PDZ domain
VPHTRWFLAAALLVPIGAALAPSEARASVNLINDQGATAPCIGVGPLGGPAAEYCGKLFEENGFLRVADEGATGLTLGTGDQDGVIVAVLPGSAAANAGLTVGDVVVQVGDRPVEGNPGAVAAQHLFGRRGDKTKVHIRRDGTEMDLVLRRMSAPTPIAPPPTSTNPFVAIKPLVDWRGKFIPCVAIGPLGFAAIAFCNGHFKPYGYVPIADAASPGVEMDLARSDKAVVVGLDPEGTAAGLMHPGDEVLAVDGVAIVGSRTAVVNASLFGKVGEQKRLRVSRAGRPVAATLVLAAKP